MADLRQLHHKALEDLREYFHNNIDTDNVYQAIARAVPGYTPLNLDHRNRTLTSLITDHREIEKWPRKPLHRKYRNDPDAPHIHM